MNMHSDFHNSADPPTIERNSDEKFEARIEALVDEAEDIRMSLMRAHSGRTLLATASMIIFVALGAGGFGWFLLVEGRIDTAVFAMLIGVALPYIIHNWAEKPLLNYKRSYKTKFMPKLAKMLGGFHFHPHRGVPSKVLARTGIVPRHGLYKAEDCFTGMYNGVKVIFSEARLFPKKRQTNPVFDGIFVLLEIPNAPFQGHSILTSDYEMIKHYAGRRWKHLQHTSVQHISGADQFSLYSDAPESMVKLLNDKLFKELSEAATIFDNAHITAVFFAKKYIFLMIPYAHDMFEACNIHMPIKTHQHIRQCRREIEQVLEIIDVFDLYQQSGA